MELNRAQWTTLVVGLLVGLALGLAGARYLDARPATGAAEEEAAPAREGVGKTVEVQFVPAVEGSSVMTLQAPAARIAATREGDPGLVEPGHQTVHLYPRDWIVWRCLDCPDGSRLLVRDLHEVNLEKAVDIALDLIGLARKTDLMELVRRFGDDPEACPRPECSERVERLLGALGDPDAFRIDPPTAGLPAGDFGPVSADEPLESTPVGRVDGHHLMKFTWVVELESVEEPVTLDPHIHAHEDPWGR